MSTMDSVQDLRKVWRSILRALDKMRERQSAASLLSEACWRMMFYHECLLELGVDASDLDKWRLVPVPTERHPQTKKQERDWDAEIRFNNQEYLRYRAMTAVGTHVVCQAVGKQNLLYGAAVCLGKPEGSLSSDLVVLSAVCAWFLRVFSDDIKRRYPNLEYEALEAMLWSCELTLLMQWFHRAKAGPPAAQRHASNFLTAWARENINVDGKAGQRLKRIVESESADTEAWLERELQGALQVAWKEREPREALRSTGKREMNLRRRVGKILEDAGSEAAVKPNDVVSTPLVEKLTLATEFETQEEAVRQTLDALEQAADFSAREAEVWRLCRRGLEEAEIAAELGMTTNNVYVQKHNAIKKMKEARKAAGF